MFLPGSDCRGIILRSWGCLALDGVGCQSLAGGVGCQSLAGEVGCQSLAGGVGCQSLAGGVGCHSLAGGVGCQTLAGGLDGRFLAGGFGCQTLACGVGCQTLAGGVGCQTLTGGVGCFLLSWAGGSSLDLLAFESYEVVFGLMLIFHIREGSCDGSSSSDVVDWSVEMVISAGPASRMNLQLLPLVRLPMESADYRYFGCSLWWRIGVCFCCLLFFVLFFRIDRCLLEYSVELCGVFACPLD